MRPGPVNPERVNAAHGHICVSKGSFSFFQLESGYILRHFQPQLRVDAGALN